MVEACVHLNVTCVLLHKIKQGTAGLCEVEEEEIYACWKAQGSTYCRLSS
jgi:hypothetical protein